MKLTKYIKAAAALLVAATALAGCKFEGTKTDFKDYEYNSFAAKGSATAVETISKTAQVVGYPSSITKAEAKTAIEIVFVSHAYLDEKSIDAAVDAYALDNASAANLPYARGAVLTKTLRRVVKTEHPNGLSDGSGEWWDGTGTDYACVETQVYYYIDASSVTKNKIAFVVDATKLKEKNGKLVLNYNGNEKCGEESDSVIAYATVSAKSDGSAPDSLTTGHAGESYQTPFSLSASGGTLEVDSEGKRTGVVKYTVAAPSATGADGLVYGDGFAADLGSMYTFLTLPIGAKKWTENALTWTYNTTTKEYETKSPALEYGTQYRLLVKENNSLEFAAATTYRGHTVRLSWKKNKNYWTDSATYQYMTSEPDYIYSAPDNTETITTPTTWNQTQITLSSGTNGFATPQNNVIEKEVYNGNKVIFKIRDTYTGTKNIRFDGTAGFIITDAKGNIIKTKAPVVYEEDDKGVKAVMIEVDNAYTNLSSGFTFWVGDKTSIKANAAHPSQLKFGCPAVETTYGPAGYVKIN